MNNKKILVLGGGPTGLGACIRLQQLGHTNWCLIDKNDFTGGLATTFKDENNFLWDIGGHVIFSHYSYFNDVIDRGLIEYAKLNNLIENQVISTQISDESMLEQLWCVHNRESWIRFDQNAEFIPYPFQNSFIHLNDKQIVKECLDGLLEINQNSQLGSQSKKIENFYDLIYSKFGNGLAKNFMIPYNLKVWGYPAEQMNSSWISERVSMVDFKNTLNEYLSKDDQKPMDKNWGPNSVFKYPRYGGNGSIWRGVGALLDEKNLMLNTEIVEIDIESKQIRLSNSNTISYDYIISTIPIDILLTKIIKPTNKLDVENLFKKHELPKYSKTNIIGLGFECNLPDELKHKSWMYFPSLNRSLFYRITVLSNYSPNMVPKPNKQWSLLCEICDTEYLREIRNTKENENVDLIQETINGLLNENIINLKHVECIVSKYMYSSEYGYPTPYLKRDEFLNEIEPVLRNKFSIYTRGRFGGWKYEVSNQDHSLMQGVEAIDNILFGCEEQTYFYPDHVNSRKETTRRYF